MDGVSGGGVDELHHLPAALSSAWGTGPGMVPKAEGLLKEEQGTPRRGGPGRGPPREGSEGAGGREALLPERGTGTTLPNGRRQDWLPTRRDGHRRGPKAPRPGLRGDHGCRRRTERASPRCQEGPDQADAARAGLPGSEAHSGGLPRDDVGPGCSTGGGAGANGHALRLAMTIEVDAVYEDGVWKPERPLGLKGRNQGAPHD